MMEVEIMDVKTEVNKVIDECVRERKDLGDNVHHPKHYELADGVEVIDVIRSVTGEGFPAYCRGNAIKYLCRADHKGGVEDLRKAMVYIGWEIEVREAK